MKIEQLIQEYREKSPQWLYGSAVVAAGAAAGQIQIGVPSSYYFHCHYLSGSYTSINGGVDVGVNGLSMRLEDQGKHLVIFDAFIPCSLFLSPGRQRTSGVAGDPSHPFFMPVELDHLFRPISTINVQVANAFTSDCTLNLVFMGTAYWIEPSKKYE